MSPVWHGGGAQPNQTVIQLLLVEVANWLSSLMLVLWPVTPSLSVGQQVADCQLSYQMIYSTDETTTVRWWWQLAVEVVTAVESHHFSGHFDAEMICSVVSSSNEQEASVVGDRLRLPFPSVVVAGEVVVSLIVDCVIIKINDSECD